MWVCGGVCGVWVCECGYGCEWLCRANWLLACADHCLPTTVEYNQARDPRDVSALFEQKVPLCYLELQKAIRKTVADFIKEEKAPVLLEKEFR